MNAAGIDSTAIPEEWTGMRVAFPEGRSVLDLFRDQLAARPAAVAIEDGPRRMSYRELDSCANRIAHELLRHGLKPEEPVAVFLPASCEFLAAILGVLKAGGSYFPVATDTLPQRLRYMLNDSGSELALTDQAGEEHFQEWPGTVVAVETMLAPGGPETDRDPGVPGDLGRRAYINYTSGSTGQPKGVEIEHRALANFIHCYQRHFAIAPRDRASLLAYVAFDVSAGDIWPTLCAGGVLVIPPAGILLDPEGLIKWLAAERITLSFVATGLAEIILSRPWPREMALRYLITGGDRLRVRPPGGLPFVLVNGYGPTENTVFSTWSVVLPEDGSQQPPPIGVPLANTTAYVLDEGMQAVAAGVAGELYVGGTQLARGYLGNPELTAERFVPDPFAAEPGARMYRTGDWASWLPDGELAFLGRKDGQIQIRGRRVELGEIEAALFTHHAVRHVCCVPWLVDGMPSAVVAHVVPGDPSPGLPDQWKTYLEPLLQGYMVPSKFVLHAELPLTAQGKHDRKALIALQAPTASAPADLAPGANLESRIARLWISLLPAAADSPPDATFSSLGGDSLLAIQLMLGLEAIVGMPFETSTFLVEPTLPGLIRIVNDRLAGSRPDYVTLRREGSRPPLFVVHGINGDVNELVDLANALGDDQPVYGLLSPALHDPSFVPESMEATAAGLLPWLRKLHPKGPICLAGYSWGGVLAFELARQVSAAEGTPPLFIAMVDSLAPPRSVSLALRIRHCLRWLPVAGWHILCERQKRQGRLSRLAGLVRGLTDPEQNQAHTLPVPEFLTGSPVSLEFYHLLTHYRPNGNLAFHLDFFAVSDIRPPCAHPFYPEDSRFMEDLGWSLWSGLPSRVHHMPGNHASMIRPPEVSLLAKSLRESMDERLSAAVIQPRK